MNSLNFEENKSKIKKQKKQNEANKKKQTFSFNR